MTALGRLLDVLRRRRPSYLLYLVTGVAWPRLRYRCCFSLSSRKFRFVANLSRLGIAFLAGLALTHWLGAVTGVSVGVLSGLAWWGWRVLSARRRERRLLQEARSRLRPAGKLEADGMATDWQAWPVEPQVRLEVERKLEGCEEVILGQVDADGRLLSPFGAFPDFDSCSAAEFVPRSRYDLDLTLLGGRLAMRKDYRGDCRTFHREWILLDRLAGHARVPAVLAVDENRCRLTRGFLAGETLNDLLVSSGARIRLSQTRGDGELEGLDETARLEAVLERGTRHLGQTVSEAFLLELERQMEAIHRRGVTGLSLTFSNVVVPSPEDTPCFFDFDDGRLHPQVGGPFFALERDRDRRKFNKIYGRDVLTEQSARALLATPALQAYAPVDLGDGLVTRGFWTVDSGTGRWQYLNERALRGHIEGKRILDLGSHNCVLPLLMMQAGAREVVAVERSEENCQSARWLAKLFRWRDLRAYPLPLETRDMRAVLTEDWGAFDLVTAFCSLYYLEEEEMAQVVRKAAELAPIMVLQAKNDTRTQATEDKAKKSSSAYLKRLLEANGFPRVEVIAPPGFSRPLLLGRKATTEPAGTGMP